MVNEIDITIAQKQSTGKPKSFRIPVYTGIFEHYNKIGDALWLLLYYIDKTTREGEDEHSAGSRVGFVLGGSPIRDSTIAGAFGCDKRTICRWRNHLAEEGYIAQRITPYGTVVRLRKSKKRFVATEAQKNSTSSDPNRDKNVPPTARDGTQTARSGTQTARSGTQTALAKKTGHTLHDTTETKEALFNLYSEHFEGRKPSWFAKDTESLKVLGSKHSQETIMACYEWFLDGNEVEGGAGQWAASKNFPFGFFLKHFDAIAEIVDRNRRQKLDENFSADALPEDYDPEKMCEVETARPRRCQVVQKTVAALWLASGYATSIIENSQRIPQEVVTVRHYGITYMIDKQKAPKYLNSGTVTEVKR